MNTVADLSGNPQRFILFGVFYNARAYYPVLAILFLDLGLSLDQFVLLNLVWAATIFVFEVPSGALADTLGRRALLITAAVLMILEMSCLLLAPRNGGTLLFTLCIINRLLSGLSEAFASGADEALAYDSLPSEGREKLWDQTLATAMRWRSVGFVIAMVLGGLVYDPTWLNHYLPTGWQLAVNLAHRLPVAIVLVQALVCLVITLRMVESKPDHPSSATRSSLKDAFRLTLGTARWLVSTPHPWVVVLVGLAIDCIVRNFATLNSSYYQLIGLPAWSYGLIGAGIGLLGWFVPPLAQKMNQRFSPLFNLTLAAGVTLLGLAAASQAWPIYGIIPAMVLMTVLGFLGFTVSRVLHKETDSSRRATVLSVKGMTFNLGYGAMSLGFSRLLANGPRTPSGAAFKAALAWQVPVFAIAISLLLVWAKNHWQRQALSHVD
jgi:MFS family permease